ncbi:IgA peptidase M64-domain-containing protein [Collybia nuda]|uniref:IgA peptidase M64-domain-containing protein n=1 Tax=Collybia nuda TaxID=64659 RepID=A0A9P5YET4_9AGAR|nr:IgA peptidase M64-domain-containing protein [Collybia nuda]
MFRHIALAIAAATIGGCQGLDFQTVLRDDHPYTISPLPGKCPSKYFPAHAGTSVVPSPPLQIHPLIVSGPSSNRVDLVFFSDGYTDEEQDKFIEDAARLAEDISGNQTFSTVRPLMNFWAAFSASKESGIGVGGVPKDTTYGLYRDGTELRGVYYDKPEVAGAACSSMGEQCDYPILLGNDPYYGGLGGQYTVITSSLANGPLVLRHELGHSIIDVGEEYDGGFAYFGPNAATDLSEPIPWTQWLSNPPKDGSTDTPRVERAVMPLQEYAWTLLNTSTSWSTTFISSGAYARHLVRFSLSGLPESKDLRVELDGLDLEWAPKVDIGLDRWHYDIHLNQTLAGGQHEVKFTLINAEREGVAQLCSVEIIEFGDETEFVSTPGHYGLYPTFSEKNETSYRPTNEDCLMRIVTSPNFCKACIEGLWLSLLKNVSLIDDIQESCEEHSGGWVKTLDLKLVPLAQFRADTMENKNEESYTITWWKDQKILPEFTNQTRLEIAGDDAVGTYAIGVKFATQEVRIDKEKLLSAGARYKVTRNCNAQGKEVHP